MKKIFTLAAIVIAMFTGIAASAQGEGFGHHGRPVYEQRWHPSYYGRYERPRYENYGYGWGREHFVRPFIFHPPFVRDHHYRRF
jgi:hypothetical protein